MKYERYDYLWFIPFFGIIIMSIWALLGKSVEGMFACFLFMTLIAILTFIKLRRDEE